MRLPLLSWRHNWEQREILSINVISEDDFNRYRGERFRVVNTLEEEQVDVFLAGKINDVSSKLKVSELDFDQIKTNLKKFSKRSKRIW